ncbi:hypothetical protein [Providencia hangzhouensis]|uniref:hypothetical protein n=1 Tax=Providencia hangzhouensis TaxID=3031799 RepID=UPI0034DD2EEC
MNDIPNFSENELKEVLKQAMRHDVLIDYNQPLSFDNQFNQIKASLMSKRGTKQGYCVSQRTE